jgi:hypothetical protein
VVSGNEPAEHPLEKAVRDFQDRITAGTFEGIWTLDEASLDRVMECQGRCVCPLVTRGVIGLESGLCRCALHWLRMLIERHVRGPVRVELVESAAGGSADCVFRVTLPDGASPGG